MADKFFVWVMDPQGFVYPYPGNRAELNYLPNGTWVTIYEQGKTFPTHVVEGVVVFMGPERRRTERGLEHQVFTKEVPA